MISRKNRIDNPTEVREILKDSDVYAGKHIMLFYRPTSAPARVGVISDSPRRVLLHSMYRSLNKIARNYVRQNPQGYDFILVPLSKHDNAEHEVLVEDFRRVISTLNSRRPR